MMRGILGNILIMCIVVSRALAQKPTIDQIAPSWQQFFPELCGLRIQQCHSALSYTVL